MTKWIESNQDQSHRFLRRFSFLPVKTLDHGWVWLRKYWVFEQEDGMFHDWHPYVDIRNHHRAPPLAFGR